MRMRVAIGSDHAGFLLKSSLVDWLKANNYDFLDVGTDSLTPVDYPDFAFKVAEAITDKSCDRGIIICGSGVGANVAANKVKGIRASVCHDTYSAHQGVEHDDMNILVLGSRVIGIALAEDIVKTFLQAQFMPLERFIRRLNKVLEKENR